MHHVVKAREETFRVRQNFSECSQISGRDIPSTAEYAVYGCNFVFISSVLIYIKQLCIINLVELVLCFNFSIQ